MFGIAGAIGVGRVHRLLVVLWVCGAAACGDAGSQESATTGASAEGTGEPTSGGLCGGEARRRVRQRHLLRFRAVVHTESCELTKPDGATCDDSVECMGSECTMGQCASKPEICTTPWGAGIWVGVDSELAASGLGDGDQAVRRRLAGRGGRSPCRRSEPPGSGPQPRIAATKTPVRATTIMSERDTPDAARSSGVLGAVVASAP